jgi:hypothetical protein
MTFTTSAIATIRVRKRADESVRYTAQIRIKRDGIQVYQETRSFVRKQAAQAWIRKRESELDQPGAIERLSRTGVSVKDMIDRYRFVRPAVVGAKVADGGFAGLAQRSTHPPQLGLSVYQLLRGPSAPAR